jgi:hypothetical protein
MAVDARWHRWVYASIADHLHTICTSAGISLVVEFLDERTTAWKTASPRAEAIITGPMSKEVSNGLHRVWVDVFLTLTSNRSSNDYVHVGHAGTLANALDQCILVKDYGDTGLLDISVLNPIRDSGRTVAVQHVRPSEQDEEIHSTIQSRFYGLFAEN